MMNRLRAAVLAAGAMVAVQGCTLQDVKKIAPSSTSKSAPAAPKGWHRTGSMTVNGQVVPVYSEDDRGEGQSPYQMALNPSSGRIERFMHDEVGNVIWKPDAMEGSAPGG